MKRNTTIMISNKNNKNNENNENKQNNQHYQHQHQHQHQHQQIKRKNKTQVIHTQTQKQKPLQQSVQKQKYNNQINLKYQTKSIVNLLIIDLIDIFEKLINQKERQAIIHNAMESCDQLFHTQNWQFHPTIPDVLKNQYQSLVPDQQPLKKQKHPMPAFDKIIRQKKIEKILTLEDSRRKNNRTKNSSSKVLSIKSNRGSVLSILSKQTQANQHSSSFVSKLIPLNLNIDTSNQMNQTRRIEDILRDKKNHLQVNNNLKGKVFFNILDQRQNLNLNATIKEFQKTSQFSKSSRGYALNLNNSASNKFAQIRTNVHTSRQEYNYDQNGDALLIKKRQNHIKNLIKVVKTQYSILKDTQKDKTYMKRFLKRQIMNVKLKPLKKISSTKNNQLSLSDLKNLTQEDEYKTGLMNHFLKQKVHFREIDQKEKNFQQHQQISQKV